MTELSDSYEISEDPSRVDFERVHAWLAGSYWSPGVSTEIVRRAAANSSIVISVFEKSTGAQVGYARVISDKSTFAWLADVFVDETHRGRGIGKMIVRHALAHPEHQNLRRWMLATADAHSVYESCGFTLHPQPERVMSYRPGEIYQGSK